MRNGNKSIKARQIFLATGAATAWFAVIFQFYLQILNRATPVSEAIVRFFSYFTIQTNILVALCFTILLLKPESDWGKFFSRTGILTAIAVYITFVGIAYNILLRHLWKPEGLQQIVDELLHSINPVIFILFWLIFVPKAELRWRNTLSWVIYPIVYLLFILTRGALSGFYPYPFVDVNNLGYHKALLNDGGLIIAFMLLSILFVTIGNLMARSFR